MGAPLLAALLADAMTANGLAAVVAVVATAVAGRRLLSPCLPMLVFGSALVVLALLALGSAPALDDFGYAVAGRDGWLAFQVAHWHAWSGRFLATAILSGWPRILPLDGAYPLMVIGVLAVAVSGLATLAWRLLPTTWPRGDRTAIVAWALLALLAGWPSLAEGIFWLPGSVTYLLPIGLASWAHAWLLLPADPPAPKRLIAAVLLAGLACGASELVALLQSAGLAVLCVRGWRRSDPRRRWWYAACACAAVATACSLAAPGNQARQAAVTATGVAVGPIAACATAWQTGLGVVLSGFAGLGVIASLVAIVRLAARQSVGRVVPGWAALVVLALALLLAASLYVPAALAGVGLAPRIAIVPWCVVIALATTAAILLGAWLASPAGRPSGRRLAWVASALTRPGRGGRIGLILVPAVATPVIGAVDPGWGLCGLAVLLAAVLVSRACAGLPSRRRRSVLAVTAAALTAATAVLGICSWGGVAGGLADLPRLPAQRRAAEARRAAIHAAIGQDLDLPLRDPDSSLPHAMVSDITGDRDDWSNRGMAAWYGLRTVRVGSPAPPHHPAPEPR